MEPAASLVELTAVDVRYGRLRALREVSLSLGRGVTGLLGPNGAGKTTLLRTLATASVPDSGTLRVLGLDLLTGPGLQAVRRRLGYLPQNPGFPGHFSAFDFIDYMGILKEIGDRDARRTEADRVLRQVGLTADRSKRIRKLSGGMRQRVGRAAAIVGDPELLVLDEPTVGLDPEQRLRFRELIAGLGEGRTVLLSTHRRRMRRPRATRSRRGHRRCEVPGDTTGVGAARRGTGCGAARSALRRLSPPGARGRRQFPQHRSTAADAAPSDLTHRGRVSAAAGRPPGTGGRSMSLPYAKPRDPGPSDPDLHGVEDTAAPTYGPGAQWALVRSEFGRTLRHPAVLAAAFVYAALWVHERRAADTAASTPCFRTRTAIRRYPFCCLPRARCSPRISR